MTTPLREALAAGRFGYVVELVASALSREAQVLETASSLARLPQVVAGSITSYAGGAMGHDPLRVAAAARARGLTPNLHLTCVSQDRRGLRKTLEDMHALSLENVFALTGDYPKKGDQPPVFDLDSVQLVQLIASLRRDGMPFHTAVAVSPFKYTEADCVYQYVKLEKKIAAGADLAITQVGWDARKFAELKHYLDARGLRTPLLGNVYVLGPRTAERMARGEPPGCWVSPDLLAAVRVESQARDGGRRARLERAARTVAVLRGLGYAGAYLGGTHDAQQIAWIIRRAEELFPQWEALAAELSYGDSAGFYLDARPPMPPRRRTTVVPQLLERLGRLVPMTRGTRMGSVLARVLGWVDRSRPAATALERVELAVKKPLFGCQACGNCVLGHLEYVCPQTCPKQLRNGPCGGTRDGWCEVVPDQPCVWVSVYDRAREAGRVDSLKTYVPPPDRQLQGTSSWINYYLGRDSRPRDRDEACRGTKPVGRSL
jgi:methylenetetrahydrofolate reductase (NADH)